MDKRTSSKLEREVGELVVAVGALRAAATEVMRLAGSVEQTIRQTNSADHFKEVASRSQKEFGKRLRILRIGQGMTQDELAAAIGVSKQAVSKYECGQTSPRRAQLMALCAALGCSRDELEGDW